MRRSKDNRTDGDIHNTTCVVEPDAGTIRREHIPKLIKLLKEKVEMGIMEPSRRFIQYLQPVNKVMIRNVGIDPSIDEFIEAFAGRSIYSIGDLYSGYDQFQLAVDNRDITTMRTPIGFQYECAPYLKVQPTL